MLGWSGNMEALGTHDTRITLPAKSSDFVLFGVPTENLSYSPATVGTQFEHNNDGRKFILKYVC